MVIMKRISLWSAASLAVLSALALTLTGCTNEMDEIYLPEKTTEFEFAHIDEIGKRVFVINPWKDDEVVIPINVDLKSDIELIGNRFNWEQKKGQDKNFLILTLKDRSDKTPFLTKVKIPELFGERTRGTDIDVDTNFYIISKEDNTKTEQVTLPHAYLDQIGKGVNLITGEFLAAPRYDLLDIKALWAAGQVQESHNPVAEGTEISDASSSEVTSKLAINAGLDLLFPPIQKPENWWRGAAFSGSVKYGWSKSTKSSNEFEYHVDIYKKAFVAYYTGAKFTEEEMGAEQYTAYLTDDANELLNDPDSKLYQIYPNTYEGIKALFDKYGTHVTTGGVFGGSFMAMYRRKATSYYTSTSHDFSFSLSCRKKGQGEAANWMESYLRKQAMQGGTLTFNLESENTDLQETSEEEYKFEVRGGNESSDFDKWDASLTDANSNLALISYSVAEGMNNLIPMHYLAADPDRRNAMIKYYDQYKREHSDTTKHRLVVADFMMVKGKNGHKEAVTDRQFAGPDGVVRNYLPLVMNKNFHNHEEWGKMVETSSSDFLAVGDATDQLWYVALDYHDACTPITDIAFMTKDQYLDNDYMHRGDSSQEGMNYPTIDEKWVCLKLAGPKADPSSFITAVGLCHKWNGSYKVITSSQGTEWKIPFVDDTNFKKYFNVDYVGGETNDKMEWQMGWYPKEEKQHYSAWFGNVGATHGKDYLFPCFSKKSLDVNTTMKDHAVAQEW